MNKKSNSILQSTLAAVGIAATLFCICGIIFDAVNKGNFHLESYAFTKMVTGTLIIGFGFGLPTFVYNNDSMSVAIQSLIHMGIGCVVMTLTAFVVGWIPTEKGISVVLAAIAAEIAIAMLIWLFFYIHNKKLAKEMNKRIAEINR